MTTLRQWRRRWRVELVDPFGRPLPWTKHPSERTTYEAVAAFRADPGLRGYRVKVWTSDDGGERWRLHAPPRPGRRAVVTATADEVVAAYEAGRTVREIIEATGRSRAWIYKQLAERDVALGHRPRGPKPLQLPLQSITEYENGATTPQLAEKYQRDVDAVAKFLRRNGVELRGRRGPRVNLPDGATGTPNSS